MGKPGYMALVLELCHLGVSIWLRSWRGRICFCDLRTRAQALFVGGALFFQRDQLGSIYIEHKGRDWEEVTAIVIKGPLFFQLKDWWWASRETLARYLIISTWSYISKAFLQHTCSLSQGRRWQEGGPLSFVITGAASSYNHIHNHWDSTVRSGGSRVVKRQENREILLSSLNFVSKYLICKWLWGPIFPYSILLPGLICLTRRMMIILYSLQNVL